MKNLLCRTKSGRRKGSLGLVLDSDAADEAASTNGAAAAPAPADAVEDANHSHQKPTRGLLDRTPAPIRCRPEVAQRRTAAGESTCYLNYSATPY